VTPATVTREGDRLVLDTPFELKDQVKRLPGRRWDKRRRRWHVPATQETVLQVRDRLGDVQCDRATLELLARSANAVDARSLRFAEELPPIPGVEPNPLNPEGGGWLHQRRGYWFAREQEAPALVMGMGTGKSLVTVKLLEAWDVQLAVVLCPSKVRKVWPREFAKWGDRDWIVDNGRFRKRDGRWKKDSSVSLKQRVARMQENIEKGRAEGRPVAIVVNYEAAWQGAMREFLLSLQIDALTYDEIHKVKAPGGKWSRFVAELRKRAKRRIGATGTLIPHSEPDVYGEYRALDPGYFGTNFGQFQRRFFEMGGYEDHEVLGFLSDAAQQEFNETWQRNAYICDEDVLDLPGAIDTPPVTIELGTEARKAYAELDDDFITWVTGGGSDDEPVTAANALVKILRLQQVTSGYLPIGEEGELVSLGDEKKRLLREELEDIPTGEPVVVYARFVEDLQRIQEVSEELGRRYAEISGRRDDGLVEDPDDPSQDATMNPNCDLLGCQLRAAAEGIDLTRSAIGIFYSLELDLGLYLQIRKRQDRPGQTRLVRFGFLQGEGTVDEIIRLALHHREDAVAACIRAAKEMGRLEVPA
jgi:SNF2 family DNA or RNA helicase